jgi:bifunctional ADP-heptose synthase (sugar kinase/adenylyltransferase)
VVDGMTAYETAIIWGNLLGCLFAMLGEKSASPWLLAVGLVVLAASMVASNFSTRQEEQYRGFTSEAAIIVTYGLGAAVWLGYATLAVMLASGANLADAMRWANRAAGIVVGKLGTATVTPAELQAYVAHEE